MFRNKLLGIYSVIVLFSVLFLIFAGAAVTSNQAGLAVPDWPTTYGENMFTYPVSKWRDGIFYEHGHRLIAAFVGMLTVILAIWIWFVESRKWVKVIGALSVLTVILQGILGGITVLLRLPLLTSAGHAVLGQTFFCLIVILAFSQLKECRIGDVLTNKKVRLTMWAYFFLTLCVYLQLILGALMRHSESGLAVPDFPTSGGHWIPRFDQQMLTFVNNNLKVFGKDPVSMSQIYIHMAHRLFAFFVVLLALFNYFLIKYYGDFKRAILLHSYYLFAFMAFQAFLGVLVVFSLKLHVIASMHVMVGAIMLALSLLLVLRLLSVDNRDALASEGSK